MRCLFHVYINWDPFGVKSGSVGVGFPWYVINREVQSTALIFCADDSSVFISRVWSRYK